MQVLGNRMAPISVSLAFGTRSSASKVNGTARGLSFDMTVGLAAMLFHKELNDKQGNVTYNFSSNC